MIVFRRVRHGHLVPAAADVTRAAAARAGSAAQRLHDAASASPRARVHATRVRAARGQGADAWIVPCVYERLGRDPRSSPGSCAVGMDGFDLGIGILFPGVRLSGANARSRDEFDRAGVDGNVVPGFKLGGGGPDGRARWRIRSCRLAPDAPLIAMLLALGFRGVASGIPPA